MNFSIKFLYLKYKRRSYSLFVFIYLIYFFRISWKIDCFVTDEKGLFIFLISCHHHHCYNSKGVLSPFFVSLRNKRSCLQGTVVNPEPNLPDGGQTIGLTNLIIGEVVTPSLYQGTQRDIKRTGDMEDIPFTTDFTCTRDLNVHDSP